MGHLGHLGLKHVMSIKRHVFFLYDIILHS